MHSTVGLFGWQLSDSEKNIKSLFLFVLISNIPDIDFLLFMFFRSEEARIHQGYTHNIFFIIFITLLMFIFFKTRKARITLILVAFSHLLLDAIILDPVPPIGFRIFSPLWDRLFNFGFFPNFLRGGLRDVFSWHNFLTVSLEILFFVIPILLICARPLAIELKRKEFWKIK